MLNHTEYPFAQLDELVEIRLNPDVNLQVVNDFESNYAALRDQFEAECDHIWKQLKSQTFCLLSEESVKAIIGQYLSAINHLKHQLSNNLNALLAEFPQLSSYQMLIALLDKLESAIRERYAGYLTNLTAPQLLHKPMQGSPFKILCHLSTDQLGLIIKAADETRLIEARSLSLVYQTIVPFLSTSKKENLSWDAMRSSTYHPEEIDRMTAIAALEKMIVKIKGYR